MSMSTSVILEDVTWQQIETAALSALCPAWAVLTEAARGKGVRQAGTPSLGQQARLCRALSTASTNCPAPTHHIQTFSCKCNISVMVAFSHCLRQPRQYTACVQVDVHSHMARSHGLLHQPEGRLSTCGRCPYARVLQGLAQLARQHSDMGYLQDSLRLRAPRLVLPAAEQYPLHPAELTVSGSSMHLNKLSADSLQIPRAGCHALSETVERP